MQSDEYSLPKIVESNRLTFGGYPAHRIVVIYDRAEEGTYHLLKEHSDINNKL